MCSGSESDSSWVYRVHATQASSVCARKGMRLNRRQVTFLQEDVQLVSTQRSQLFLRFVFFHQSNNVVGQSRRVSITSAERKTGVYFHISSVCLCRREHHSAQWIWIRWMNPVAWTNITKQHANFRPARLSTGTDLLTASLHSQTLDS